MSDKKEEIESPDYLETPKRGKGVRRLNRIPLAIIGSMVLLSVGAVTYTAFDRAQASAKGGTATDARKVAIPAVSPVPRPKGPDVALTPPAPQQAVYSPETGQMTPAAPEQETEAVRRAREERVQALKMAMASDPAITAFAMKTAAARRPEESMDDRQEPDGEEYRPDTDPNRQESKRAFLNSFDNKSPYLKQSRMAPISETEIKAGSIIPGVMISGVNSDLPGQIVGQVRQNVYDSATGRHLLIPAGAKIVGAYDSSVSAGQERVLIAWNRIIFPDASSISLETMPGADVSGYAGFKEKVDNHYWRTFGNAFLLSLFSAGIQLSQPRQAVNGTFTSQSIMAAEIGRQLGRLGMQLTQRNLNIQPTLEISPGYQFSVMVTKDIVLPPWRG